MGPKTLRLPVPTFWKAVWISPLAFLIHALEDAPRLAGWMNSVPMFEHVTERQLLIALAFLVGSAILATCVAVAGAKWRICLYWFLWMQGFLFLHGIAHLLPSIWVLGYTPGFWTALLLDIPVATYLLRRAWKESIVSRKTFVIISISAVLLYDPFLRLAFQIGAEKIPKSDPSASPAYVAVRLSNPSYPAPVRSERQAQAPNIAHLTRKELR
jgi:Protein of unknown function with HXXEE motif